MVSIPISLFMHLGKELFFWMMNIGRVSCMVALAVLLSQGLGQAAAPSDHADAAHNYMRQAQWEYASFEWRSILAQNPADVEANVGLAESLVQSGLPQDAVKHLEQVIKTVPDPRLQNALASAYFAFGKLDQAQSLYEGVLQKDPYNLKAFKGLNNLLEKLPPEKKEAANALLLNIATRARDSAKQAMQANNYADAATYLEVAAIYFHKADVVNDYGLVLLLAGRKDDSVRFFRLMNNQNIKIWLILANAALAELSLGNIKEAVKNIEESISLCSNPRDKAKLYNNLGYIYEVSKRPLKARYAYEKALSLDGSLLKTSMNLAYILQRTGDYKAAVETYKQILRSSPHNAEVWTQLGFTYELLYKPEQALQSYQKAIQVDPRCKAAYYNMGTLYKKLEKMDKATEAYKQLTNLEFNEMENPQSATTESYLSKILKYVNVFFSDSVG